MLMVNLSVRMHPDLVGLHLDAGVSYSLIVPHYCLQADLSRYLSSACILEARQSDGSLRAVCCFDLAFYQRALRLDMCLLTC